MNGHYSDGEIAQIAEAVKTCRRLKGEPIDVKYSGGGRYTYDPHLDTNQVEYNIARGVIHRYPMLERLLQRWI